MKHILTSIAAVVLMGCGRESPQSIESVSNIQTNNPIQNPPKTAVKTNALAPVALDKDKVQPAKFTDEVYKKAFPEISGYYYKKSNILTKRKGNSFSNYRTAIGIISISKTIDDKGLRPIFSFSKNSTKGFLFDDCLILQNSG